MDVLWSLVSRLLLAFFRLPGRCRRLRLFGPTIHQAISHYPLEQKRKTVLLIEKKHFKLEAQTFDDDKKSE